MDLPEITSKGIETIFFGMPANHNRKFIYGGMTPDSSFYLKLKEMRNFKEFIELPSDISIAEAKKLFRFQAFNTKVGVRHCFFEYHFAKSFHRKRQSYYGCALTYQPAHLKNYSFADIIAAIKANCKKAANAIERCLDHEMQEDDFIDNVTTIKTLQDLEIAAYESVADLLSYSQRKTEKQWIYFVKDDKRIQNIEILRLEFLLYSSFTLLEGEFLTSFSEIFPHTAEAIEEGEVINNFKHLSSFLPDNGSEYNMNIAESFIHSPQQNSISLGKLNNTIEGASRLAIPDITEELSQKPELIDLLHVPSIGFAIFGISPEDRKGFRLLKYSDSYYYDKLGIKIIEIHTQLPREVQIKKDASIFRFKSKKIGNVVWNYFFEYRYAGIEKGTDRVCYYGYSVSYKHSVEGKNEQVFPPHLILRMLDNLNSIASYEFDKENHHILASYSTTERLELKLKGLKDGLLSVDTGVNISTRDILANFGNQWLIFLDGEQEIDQFDYIRKFFVLYSLALNKGDLWCSDNGVLNNSIRTNIERQMELGVYDKESSLSIQEVNLDTFDIKSLFDKSKLPPKIKRTIDNNTTVNSDSTIENPPLHSKKLPAIHFPSSKNSTIKNLNSYKVVIRPKLDEDNTKMGWQLFSDIINRHSKKSIKKPFSLRKAGIVNDLIAHIKTYVKDVDLAKGYLNAVSVWRDVTWAALYAVWRNGDEIEPYIAEPNAYQLLEYIEMAADFHVAYQILRETPERYLHNTFKHEHIETFYGLIFAKILDFEKESILRSLYISYDNDSR